MNYTLRKGFFYLIFWSTIYCGFVCVNLADKNDNACNVYGSLFIIGLTVGYVWSFFIEKN